MVGLACLGGLGTAWLAWRGTAGLARLGEIKKNLVIELRGASDDFFGRVKPKKSMWSQLGDIVVTSGRVRAVTSTIKMKITLDIKKFN